MSVLTLDMDVSVKPREAVIEGGLDILDLHRVGVSGEWSTWWLVGCLMLERQYRSFRYAKVGSRCGWVVCTNM